MRYMDLKFNSGWRIIASSIHLFYIKEFIVHWSELSKNEKVRQ